ncbi:hypothetical protein NDA18_001553 [Ustilago nuda]|nr:hypothetical protein NDA18_001553 [Ustilago nuda]
MNPSLTFAAPPSFSKVVQARHTWCTNVSNEPPSSTSAFATAAPRATPRLAIHSQTKASKPTLPMHSTIIPAGATFKWPASFVPVTRDDGLLKPLDHYPCNNHFKAISELAESDLPIVLKLVEEKASKSFRTPSYETIFDVALRKPLLDLNEQLIAMSCHLHLGQAGVPVPPVLVAFDKCIEMIVTTPYAANNQLNSLRCAWNYIGTLQDEYKTLCFWLVLMSTSSSATYHVEHVGDQASLRRRNSAPLHMFVGVGVDVLSEEQRALSCASQASLHDHLI